MATSARRRPSTAGAPCTVAPRDGHLGARTVVDLVAGAAALATRPVDRVGGDLGPVARRPRLQARGTVLGAVYERQRPHVDLRRGLLRQRGQGDRGHPSSVRIALRRLAARIGPQRRTPAGREADHRGRDRAVRRRPVRMADRQPDLRIAGDPRDVLPRALGRRRPMAGRRCRGAAGVRQPAARPFPDRHARHLCAGADDLGRRLISARTVDIGRGRAGDRRLHEGGRAVRADRARADRAGAGAGRLA